MNWDILVQGVPTTGLTADLTIDHGAQNARDMDTLSSTATKRMPKMTTELTTAHGARTVGDRDITSTAVHSKTLGLTTDHGAHTASEWDTLLPIVMTRITDD